MCVHVRVCVYECDGVCVCVKLCGYAPRAHTTTRMCVRLIYNPQRKQDCKSCPQISLLEVLVPGTHAKPLPHRLPRS